MLLSDAIQAYETFRRARGVAPKTLLNEQRTLRLLLADVGNIRVKVMRPQHLDTFWANRDTWADSTKMRAAAQLAVFFRWCQGRGYMRRDIDLLDSTPRVRQGTRDWVTIPQSEFENILDGCNPRERIVVALSLYLFTRIGETAGLRWQDYDPDSSTITVYRTKTKTLDILPVSLELEAELKRWHREIGALLGQVPLPGWYIIPGRVPPRQYGVKGVKGFSHSLPSSYDPRHPANLARTVRQILERHGYYQEQEGGHTFRRSGAIALYNHLSEVGHDRAIRICQAMLGHSSIQTTEVYLRLDLDRKVRNDLLAGKRMFPESEGEVIPLQGVEWSREQSKHTSAMYVENKASDTP